MAKIFRIRGWFKQGIFTQRFSLELLAISEKQALERVLSQMGSRHKVSRNRINIEEVAEIKAEEVKDPRVLASLEG